MPDPPASDRSASRALAFGTSPPLATEVSRPHDGAVLLTVEGEVDTLTAGRLQDAVDAALDTASDTGAALVVDLGDVTFFASSGLAVLIAGARRAAAIDRRLQLVVTTRAVMRPLEVTGADALFDVHPDRASALTAAAPATIAPPHRGVGR